MKRKTLSATLAVACILASVYTVSATGQSAPAQDAAQHERTQDHGMMSDDHRAKMQERMKENMKKGGGMHGMGRGPADAGAGTARGEGSASEGAAPDAGTATHKH